VEVELRDARTQAVHYSSLSYEARDLSKGNSLSDLSIAQGFAGAEMPLQPLLGGQLIPFPEAQLTFSGEVYAAPGSTLTLRAVLYQQGSPEPGEAAGYDYDKVETFSSVQQFNRIVKTGPGGKVKFQETLPVDPLEEGEYLLEVALYAGEVRVSETGRNFSIPWKGLREVFASLDEAAERMAYAATPEVIADIRQENNSGLKQEKFLRFWNSRAGAGNSGLEVLRKYYERIYYADTQFAEGQKPGWKTDKGKVLCLYGMPSKMENLEWKGKPVEVWTYMPRNLRMVFLVEGITSRWVEPYHL
jgi:GWxTD domain-containing protein